MKISRVPRHMRPGQALVELALALTFISLLLGAAVDLGLAYKSYQTLMNATAEASTYLALMPLKECGLGCPTTDQIIAANQEARVRFRAEQGDQLRGTASTLDLDSTRQDDVKEHGELWIRAKIDIDEADASQVSMSGGVYGVSPGFNGTSDTRCQQRYRFGASARQCFIVVRTEIIYHPFLTTRLLGKNMTIRATSIKPIVGGP